MFNTVFIKKNERGLLMEHGDFVRVLESGEHRLSLNPFKRQNVTIVAADSEFNDETLLNYLQKNEAALVSRYLHVFELSDQEAGLLYANNKLVEILAPGTRRAYWKGDIDFALEKADISQGYEVDKQLTQRIKQSWMKGRELKGSEGLLAVMIPAYHVGVLKIDGKVVRLMTAATEVFWGFNRDIAVETVDMRLQNQEVSGQEILTKDKVALRISLIATWQFSDVLLAFAKLNKPAEHLYRELQFALREAIGERTLDTLLENKQSLNKLLLDAVQGKLANFGIDVTSVGLRDIILPGEMKIILAQVVEAQKAAEANVIKRREETNATRSLLNTAKVMEENATALRLKELETLERVAERIDKISVFGGLDQVLNGLISIKQ
jgi:regulator of protease activity HflC (stomatin/prohibitin superfamily)